MRSGCNGGADSGGWSSPHGPASLASPPRKVMRESRVGEGGEGGLLAHRPRPRERAQAG